MAVANCTGGATVYVSLLPEDFQNKCQLQEAHENTQVILRQTMRLKYKILRHADISLFRGEVTQGAQYPMPQVVVQVCHCSDRLELFVLFCK